MVIEINNVKYEREDKDKNELRKCLKQDKRRFKMKRRKK